MTTRSDDRANARSVEPLWEDAERHAKERGGPGTLLFGWDPKRDYRHVAGGARRARDIKELIAPPFYGVHRDVQAHRHTHYLLAGGRGSTKSSFAAIEALLLLERYPNMHALVLRKVGNTLRDSVFSQYRWAAHALGMGGLYQPKLNPLELVRKGTGQRVLFRGADDPFKIKSIKAPFGYFGVTHFEEWDQFSGPEEVRAVLQSTMRGGERFWSFETFNPPAGAAHWANREAAVQRADRLFHQSDYRAVPRPWLGAPFFEEAEQLRRVNERAWRQEYLGQAVGLGDEVFQNLRLEKISDEQAAGFDRIYMGVDWGFYPDPFAWNRMHYDAARMTLYIFDELTCTRTGNEETARLLLAKGVGPDELILADSAEAKSIADYRALGLYCRPVKKGRGSVAYGMKWLQRLAAIVIDPARCPNTAREFSGYCHARAADGSLLGGYPDKDNHHIDAVRYAMQPAWRG